jgi:hypothetical protein
VPSKTKLKNAAIAARSAALPKIPAQLLDQLVQGPMTAESILDVTTALHLSECLDCQLTRSETTCEAPARYAPA